MTAPLSTDRVIDYLDHPPKRYTRMGSALVESPTGECVMFTDMDLYMFEGGQLLLKAANSLRQINALENTPHVDASAKVAMMAALARQALT